MMIETTPSILSCKEKGPQSFLSCILRRRNQLPNTRKLNLKDLDPTALSCVAAISPESRSNSDALYRANLKEPLKTYNRKLIIGIDPGLTGALAIICRGVKPTFVAVFDMPTYQIKRKGKLRNRLDLEALTFLIESYSKDLFFSLIEEVGEIGTKADPFSSFVFGFSTGSLHGVLAALGIKIKVIHPITWKAALGLDADKDKSLQKAIKLFPEAAPFLKRKKDHGRAEALLLAYFANQISEAA